MTEKDTDIQTYRLVFPRSENQIILHWTAKKKINSFRERYTQLQSKREADRQTDRHTDLCSLDQTTNQFSAGQPRKRYIALEKDIQNYRAREKQTDRQTDIQICVPSIR